MGQQIVRKALVSVAILLSLNVSALAAGFALSEQSISAMGNAFAGAVATAEDASVMFLNTRGGGSADGRPPCRALKPEIDGARILT